MLISGEPGLGKSRIAATLDERLEAEPHIRLRQFCSPYHQNSALFPFIDQLQRAAGLRATSRPLPSCKSSRLCWPARRRRTRMSHCSPICSHLPASRRHPLPNLSSEQKKERTLEALIRQLEGLARRQPVLVLFEDAHWIDPTSRELLDLTVERVRGLPVLLIVTFRFEFQPL